MHLKFERFAIVALVVVGAQEVVRAQDAAKVEFEVASIKAAPPSGFFRPADSGSGGPGSATPTVFGCTSCTASSLILRAFGLERYQFPGLQSLPGDAFSISAKVPDGTTPQELLVMIQNLLKDRFGLKYHFEEKETQGFRLVVAKNGPKLVESTGAAPPGDVDSEHRSDGQHAAGGHGSGAWSGTTDRPGLSFFMGGARYRGDHQTTAELAQMLANQLGKPVDDQTGLTGKYDIKLSWAGETAHSGDHPAGGFDGGAGHDHGDAAGGNALGRPVSSGGPTLFEALQSQLGLRLTPAPKSTIRILVVDHIEKAPTAN